MLEFTVQADKGPAEKYLKSKGIMANLSDKLVMCAFENASLTGVGAVSILVDTAVMEEVCCEDDILAYGMGKALLNLVDNVGLDRVYCQNAHLFALAERLGFQKEDRKPEMALDLTGYFKVHK